MTLSPEKIADLRVKHLEMLQAIVARLANYGAMLKNYCITLAVAIFGFALTLQRPAIGLLALLPIMMFAFLDAQFLRNERRFRGLYDITRQGDSASVPTFEIDLRKAPNVSFWSSLNSWSIWVFYTPLLIADLVLVLAAGHVYGRYL